MRLINRCMITPITEDSFKSAKKHFVIYAQQKLWKKRKQN